MVLPVSFNANLSVGPQNSAHPPFESSGGNFYTVLRNNEAGSGNGFLSLHKATDPTDSFSQVDTEQITSTILSMWCYQDGDTIHIAAQLGNDDSYYIAADLSSDALGTEVQIEAVPTADDGPDANACSIAAESTGSDIVVAYQGDPDMITGTEFARIDANRSDDAGATWGGPISVDNAGSVHWTGPVIVLGSSDRMHIFFQDSGADDAYQRRLGSDDSLETFPSAFDAEIASSTTYPFRPGVSYDDGGTERVRCPYQDSGGIASAKLDSADTPTVTTDTSIQDNTPRGGETYAFANDGTTIHFLYADNATLDLWHDQNADDGGWGTDVEVLDAVTINHVSSNVYDRSGQKLPYIYDDGGTVKYNEVTLVAAVIPVINLVMAPYVSA